MATCRKFAWETKQERDRGRDRKVCMVDGARDRESKRGGETDTNRDKYRVSSASRMAWRGVEKADIGLECIIGRRVMTIIVTGWPGGAAAAAATAEGERPRPNVCPPVLPGYGTHLAEIFFVHG